MILPAPRRAAGALAAFAAAVLLAASPARAGEDPPGKPGPGKGRGEGFRFAPPEEPKPADVAPKAPGKAPEAPKDPIELAIRGLSTWPGQDGVKAAETLLLAGPAAVEPLERALAVGDLAVRPGAAWVLGKVGGRDDVPIILRAAAAHTSGNRLETFFQAATEIDVAIAKRWLFSFLTLQRPTFRARAADFLAGLVTADDRPKIDMLLAQKEPGVRVAGYELLARLGAPDAVDRLFDALPDVHPDVAKRASDLLAASPESVAPRLNALVRDGDARQRAYATLALVEMGRRLRKVTVEPATIGGLTGRRGLRHPEPLSRGSAAVGLAFGALDTPDPAVAVLLDQDVIDTLVDTVAGDHFLDYGSLVEPVFAALRRLSGLDFSASARPWAQWWSENRGKFRARRTLAGVAKEDTPHARVVFDAVDSDGRRRRTAFVPEGGDAVAAALVLPGPAFDALVAGVEDAGLFTQPDDPRTLADEHLAVRLGVMNQERRMVLVPTREDGRYGTLLARLSALEEENRWQRYREPGSTDDAASWRKAQRERFSALDATARREALAAMVVASFRALPGDAARADALDLLDRLGVPLTDDQALTLLSAATKTSAIGPVEARVVERVASLDRPTLADALVEALSLSGSPAASRLLEKTLSDAGVMRVREAFADQRPGVRAAGAAAAASLLDGVGARDETARRRLGDTLGAGLKALLVDPDPLVKARAAGALSLLGEPDMIARLEEVYREGDAAVRIAVAESLGRIGGTVVHPFLVRIVGEEGEGMAPVRAAALEAMARGADPDSIRILAFYMLEDKDVGVQQSAEKALTDVGTPEARGALIDLLDRGTLSPDRQARALRALATFEGPMVREALGRRLENADARVVDQAALGLARQNEGVAVPYLVALLRRPEEPLRPRALEALQDLTCVSLLVTGYEAAADQYEAWYRTHRDSGDRAWYRDALDRRGYDTAPLLPWVLKGEMDVRAVPVLLKAMRDDDAALRRGAELALRRSTGKSYGPVGRGTARDEVVRAADRWAAWWASSPSNPARAR